MCDSLDKKVRLAFVDMCDIDPASDDHVGVFIPLDKASDTNIALRAVYDLILPVAYGMVTSLLWNCICTSAGLLILDRRPMASCQGGLDVVTATWIDDGGWKRADLRLLRVL